METLQDLLIEREKILSGCGKRIDDNGDCAFSGAKRWRMCSSCNKNLREIDIQIETLRSVIYLIKEFIKSDIGLGGVQTKNFEKLKLRITG